MQIKFLKNFSVILFLLMSTIAYAQDVDLLEFGNQTATQSWSSQSVLQTISDNTFSWWYVNKDNDFWVEGNYFRWYYYDSNYWFFRFDWSSDLSQNVRIIGSTDKCSDGSAGYMFWWLAKSVDTNSWSVSGFMNFHYSNDIYVYWCMWDQKLHWLAYNDDYGFQNFEWFYFTTLQDEWITHSLTDFASEDSFFVNDYSNILNTEFEWINNIQWDIVDTEYGKEIIWTIIK